MIVCNRCGKPVEIPSQGPFDHVTASCGEPSIPTSTRFELWRTDRINAKDLCGDCVRVLGQMVKGFVEGIEPVARAAK